MGPSREPTATSLNETNGLSIWSDREGRVLDGATSLPDLQVAARGG